MSRSVFATHIISIALVVFACDSTGVSGQRIPIEDVQKIGIQLCDLFYDNDLEQLH